MEAAAGLVMFPQSSLQLAMLRRVCWIAARSLRPSTLRAAVSAWHWIAVCAPDLQVSTPQKSAVLCSAVSSISNLQGDADGGTEARRRQLRTAVASQLRHLDREGLQDRHMHVGFLWGVGSGFRALAAACKSVTGGGCR